LARAAELYLGEMDAHSLTQQIDAALETVGADQSGSDAVAVARRLLTGEDDW
jgi:hypothetical protein